MRTLRRALRLRSAKIALAVILVIAVMALFGNQIAPGNPLAQDPNSVLLGPGAHHWLGTDYLGRDVLSRLIAGTGRSVAGAVEAVAVGLVVGALPGLASLWFGRVFEWVSMRVVDALMTLPYIVFAVAVAGALGNGLTPMMFAIGILLAPAFFRVARAAALGFTRAQYVESAEIYGASRWWILRTHIWSKVLPTLAVTTAQSLAAALLTVSSLAFLGLGTEPPLPTWGELLSSDLEYLAQQPWAPLAPGLLIMIAAGALNALADAIRDSGVEDPGLEPSGRRRILRRLSTPSEQPDAKEPHDVPVPVI
jgi:peptide/nickel transport system permease protein